MAGLIAQLPNMGPKFVPVSARLLSSCTSELAEKVRGVLSTALGLDSESADNMRVLFQEKDLDSETTAAALLRSLASGVPCVVRVLFRLLGGKGGFGALLRKQMGLGKKTTNFDAMRDLSGRRLRHSKAVDRIKEWMGEKKRQDDLVNLLTGEGPELPKPTAETESLDPVYVARLKKAAASQPALVKEGMRRLDSEGADAQAQASKEQSSKRQRVGEADGGGGAQRSAGWLSALDTLGAVSSPEPESDDASGKEEPAAPEKPAKAAAPARDQASEVEEVKCRLGHDCLRLTQNPPEPGYEEPACCDVCDAEDLPGNCEHFFHCTVCQFDVCPDCAKQLRASGFCTVAPPAAAAAATETPQSQPSKSSSSRSSAAVDFDAQAPAASASAAGASGAGAGAGRGGAAAEKGASGAATSGTSAPGATKEDDGRVLGPADLKSFASAEELAREVPAEVLKRSLQKLGLKCGGKVEDRAARLFLLKTTKLGALPKAHFASK